MIAIKYLVTAFLVVFISEVAKRSDKLGGLIAALPLVSLLTIIWMYVEKQPNYKIANHAWYTFFYVIPTLPMFLVFPALLNQMNFWLALLCSVLLTVTLFFIFSLLIRRFGVNLL